MLSVFFFLSWLYELHLQQQSFLPSAMQIKAYYLWTVAIDIT